MAQDRLLEKLKLCRGLDAQLLDERLTGLPVSLEGLRLPARAVEGQHELPAEPLPQRILGHEGLELPHALRVAPELDLGIDHLLVGGGAELLHAGDLDLGEQLVGEIRERRTAPERERFAEESRPPLRIAPL